jgi:hypothetical protein
VINEFLRGYALDLGSNPEQLAEIWVQEPVMWESCLCQNEHVSLLKLYTNRHMQKGVYLVGVFKHVFLGFILLTVGWTINIDYYLGDGLKAYACHVFLFYNSQGIPSKWTVQYKIWQVSGSIKKRTLQKSWEPHNCYPQNVTETSPMGQWSH